MRSLFLKIFLWFWGAMIVIGLAFFLVVTTALPDPLPEPWRESTSSALAAYAASAANAWTQGGRAKLAAYLADQEARSEFRFQFFDEQGRELSQRPALFGRPNRLSRPRGESRPREDLPPDEDTQFRGPSGRRPAPDQAPPDRGLLPLPGMRGRRRPPDLAALRRRALQSDEAVFELAGRFVVAAQSVQPNAERNYVLLATLPTPRFGRPPADAMRQLIGVLVALVTSGLVCYGLVRYLTAPLISLRTATAQLAAGDLAARTGAAERARRDEVADLGRDFDAMAERIQALVVAQRRLLGDISHELRSPLARLGIGLALARRYATSGAEPSQIDAAFDRIKRETTRLNLLIEQLLQLTRLEGGVTTTEYKTVDLEQLVHEIVADVNFEVRGANSAESGGDAVHITSCEVCHIDGSPEVLRSAIENVLRNAVRYTRPGTLVEVSLNCEERASDDREAVIRVRDHGEGVPAEALSNLFRAFYRVADARERESGGVGLGLAITERAVHSHGGTVAARNALDGGLLVEMRFPLTDCIRRL
jgi:two-component system sensor histidine kinase CpxA